MPNIPAPRRPEEPPVHQICPLKDTLTEANIRYITCNLSDSARTEFINLAKLSQHASQSQNWALDEALRAQIRLFFETEARRIHLSAKDPPSIGTGENILHV
jgi:hypothetical protein